MQQSNAYIITFSVVMTVVLGLLLSGTSQVLGPLQEEAIALDTKKQILGAVVDFEEIRAMDAKGINEYYEHTISSIVVNIDGEEVTEQGGESVTAETVDVAKNYKLPKQDRLYPVFIYHEKDNKEQIVAYILPIYGAGLWDAIWGFMALKTDMNTIEGITLSHAGETPGLGARITASEVQRRYDDKQVFNEDGELIGVIMQKGEGKDYSSDPHKVDGMSAATITASGVNKMVISYLENYEAYLKKVQQGSSTNAPGGN